MTESLVEIKRVNGRSVAHCKCGWVGTDWHLAKLAKVEHQDHLVYDCPIGTRKTTA